MAGFPSWRWPLRAQVERGEVGRTVPCPFPPRAGADSLWARVAELVVEAADISLPAWGARLGWRLWERRSFWARLRPSWSVLWWSLREFGRARGSSGLSLCCHFGGFFTSRDFSFDGVLDPGLKNDSWREWVTASSRHFIGKILCYWFSHSSKLCVLPCRVVVTFTILGCSSAFHRTCLALG